jgi:hypothetical protein
MADLNASFSASGQLTQLDPLDIRSGTIKFTVGDPVETGNIAIAASGTETVLAYDDQAAGDYWLYIKNETASACDVVLKLNVAAADISGASGFTREDWGAFTIKQNDFIWIPLSGTGMSGKTEAVGCKLTNTSGSTKASIGYGLYKRA